MNDNESQGSTAGQGEPESLTNQHRLLIQIAEDLNRLARHTGWANHTHTWAYELRVRFPRSAMGQHGVIVKGIHEGELVVGFHSSDGLIQTLTSAGRRLEAGSFKWKPDEWPPHKADELILAWHSLTKYYRG